MLLLPSWFVILGLQSNFGEVCNPKIDSQTLHHKVLCGYQGWFRCPADGTKDGWRHWSRNHRKMTSGSVTVEMWPDLSEFAEAETYPVPGFTTPDQKPARLFSSANPQTVQRHFQWMTTYGIDGVFLQRFLVNLETPSFDKVLDNVRSSAESTGRVYATCYDLTGMPTDQIYDRVVNDWKKLVDVKKITQDKSYLHHNSKPVLVLWGLFPDRFDAALAHRLIDFFQTKSRYKVTLIGGCQWQWRTVQDKQWARAFARLDVISPWNVGNISHTDGKTVATTQHWKADMAEAKRVGSAFMPVVYPGFQWNNLKNKNEVSIPRRGGRFLWEQFVTASEMGIDMVYVAMFDEVDEATAIFKVTNSPPTQALFLTYEGLPSDWYLRLVGEGSKLIRGERQSKQAFPTQP